MTGSSYIPIVVPIVAFVTMALWLGMVFYADGHPGYRPWSSRRRSGSAAASEAIATSETAGAATCQQHEALPDAGVPAEPGEHERIDEHTPDVALR
jgi:hypothetical protein